MFGLAPRIAAASFLAFLVGSFLNAYVMSRMKKLNARQGEHFSLRAIASTVVGETADSLVFFPLALGGVITLDSHALADAQPSGLEDSIRNHCPAADHPRCEQPQTMGRRRCPR